MSTVTRTIILAGIALGAVGIYLARSGDEPGSAAMPDARTPETSESSPDAGRHAPSSREVTGRSALEADLPPTESVRRARVVTGKSLSTAGERVPRIAFQLLRARPDTVPDASFLAFAPVFPGDAPLFEGRTDERGEALIELPESQLAGDASGRPGVRVRVVEPGYQQRFGMVPVWPEEEDEAVVLRVIAWPGTTARGRVLDSAGRGIDAKVSLREWIAPGGVRKLGRGAGSRQLLDGWFEIDLTRDVVRGVLIAEAGIVGTGALPPRDFLLADPPQDLEVVARGSGRIRGRVCDAGGSPAAGLELLIWFAPLDDGVGSFVAPEPEFSMLRADGGGRLWVTLETDPEGRFDVSGLRAAPYVVRARTGQGFRSGYPILLTPRTVLADGTPLELVLSRPHLEVRLVDADRSPWSGPHAVVRTDTAWDDRIETWPSAPMIMAYRCTGTGEEETVHSDALRGRAVDGDGVLFEVPAGERYLVGALGGGFLGELQGVEVPEGGGGVLVELVAPPARELGSLSVRVFHEGLELTGKRHDGPEFDVYLESLDSAAVLLRRKQYGAATPFRFHAPAGRYRLVVEGDPFLDFYHGVLRRPREFGRSELAIELVAGETREESVAIERGGRLQLTLSGASNEADRLAVLEESPRYAEARYEQPLEYAAASAQVSLTRPGRRPETVYHTTEWTQSSAAGTHLDQYWRLGETRLSQVLPAGSYQLVARLPGGREAFAEVELHSGATTTVALEL